VADQDGTSWWEQAILEARLAHSDARVAAESLQGVAALVASALQHAENCRLLLESHSPAPTDEARK